MCRVLFYLKAMATRPMRSRRGQVESGGVYDHGTQEEDGPGTWEAIWSSLEETGNTESRTEMSGRATMSAGARVAGGKAKNKRAHRGRRPARGTEADCRRDRGSRRAASEQRRRGTGILMSRVGS